MRFTVYLLSLGLSLLFVVLAIVSNGHLWWPLVISLPLAILGTWDCLQTRHTLLRNYPVIGHFRWLFEYIRPEIHQYLVESDTEGAPYDRQQRTLIYERAKNVVDVVPFGTERDVYAEGYEWLNHSVAPKPVAEAPFRLDIGGPECREPYSASIFNISAMSFGALGAAAVRALNKGAKMGNFAHDTGEGAISPYHREFGGDLIWELGSGYFGCRHNDGSFNPELFAEMANEPQVKMVEIKLSQGAKPGHGGVLPAAKVTPEIAATRKVALGQDCVSPSRHSAFSTPIELMEFVARLRDLSGGKPAGFKLCIGHPTEFMAIVKAMIETRILPDFIVIDGGEGGTGAAPEEFSDHIGTPLREGLVFAHNVLVGAGLRANIKLGASGKVMSGFTLARNLALGADWCNAARGFMFALGCVQSQRCHTDTCPTGITTQNPGRQRALVVPDKAERVKNFHYHTVRALADVVAAAGLASPADLRPHHLMHRISATEVRGADQIYHYLAPGELLGGAMATPLGRQWQAASPQSFSPAV